MKNLETESSNSIIGGLADEVTVVNGHTYQGVLGVYFEATTGKAYPKSEDIRCDQFDVAFQAVELWIADRLVLPIET
ncbi:predicted protein [Arabidopsis lyrata subsp. lyrata]|uniref:Predicted protein n=1 Tax=Arabidopsis lyrata subsp. lyrata TaxID=81972 RepID=D7MGP8_ARALL|nr:predicted protein [Arabidopsis lyrata subsp. lyrata]